MPSAVPKSTEVPTATSVAPDRKTLRSMTGYAQAQAIENGWSLRVSIRSVNHRFLDLHLRVPEGLEQLEPGIRQMIRERIQRGHLDVSLYHELAGPAAIGVNRAVAAAYLEAIDSLRKQFSIQSEPDLASILRLPGVVGSRLAPAEEQIALLEAAASRCVIEAIDKLNRMREHEANHLRNEMLGRLHSITNLTARVTTVVERARPAFARRLTQRLEDLLGEAQIDPARLAQEAAIAAERSDVSEELTRLASHVQQFGSLLTGAADVGKKLDFLLQEMQRETNTLLSKTPGNDADGLEITQLGLEIKSEVEKLREQVQNIE